MTESSEGKPMRNKSILGLGILGFIICMTATAFGIYYHNQELFIVGLLMGFPMVMVIIMNTKSWNTTTVDGKKYEKRDDGRFHLIE